MPHHFARIVVLLGLSSAALAQRTLDPSEVQVRIIPYVPRSPVVLRVETKLVEASVVVRDSRGRPVAGLKQQDFQIFDQGKRREIKTFSVQTSTKNSASAPGVVENRTSGEAPRPKPPPRFVAILFDDLTMGIGELRPAQIAAKRFVEEGLSPGDQAAIFTTSTDQNVAFTPEIPKLVASIEKLRVRERVAFSGHCPRITPYDSYLLANNLDPALLVLKIEEAMRCSGEVPPPQRRGRSSPSTSASSRYEQAVRAQANATWGETRMRSLGTLETIESLVSALSAIEGNRMILLVSSGFLSGTLEREQDRVANRALRAGVVINTIDAKGLYAPGPLEMPPGGDVQSMIREQSLGVRPQETANDALYFLADSTGGLFFHNNNDMYRGFHDLGVLPEVSYVLGFAPDEIADGKFHRLRVTLASGRGYSLQARPGYVAEHAEQAEAKAERRIDREVLGAENLQELPVTFSARPPAESAAESVVAVLHVDIKNLQLERKMDYAELREVHARKLTAIFALFDERGNFVTGREAAVDFRLREATVGQVGSSGIAAPITLNTTRGKYRLRAVVADESESKIASASGWVEVR